MGSNRHLLRGALLLCLVLAWPWEVRASCLDVSGDPSQLPLPSVHFLRSYRASLGSPTRLAIDPTGNIYIADPARGQVVVRAPNGRVTSRIEEFGNPLSIAVDGEGRVLVGDGSLGSVTAFDSGWQPVYELGQGPGEFLSPGDIAVHGASGNIYVTDTGNHRVNVYDPTGTPVTTFGDEGSDPGQFRFPMGISIDGVTGEVLVVDQLNYRVQFFDPNGAFLRCIGGPRGSFFRPGRTLNMPQGVWVDSAGRLYVADAFDGRIRVLDRDGGAVGFIGEFGRGAGQLRIPMDMVIDPFGRLFIAAANNRRLEVFGLDEFTDPEEIVPAEVEIRPDPIDPAALAAPILAFVEVPGYRLAGIAAAGVEANGVPGSSLAEGDRDNDGIPDLRVEFDASALLATLPTWGGPAVITLSGPLGSLRFEGEDAVDVLAVHPPDADGDGVLDDADVCPGTLSGSAADADGCSIFQLCPCEGPEPTAGWRNHGNYVKCVAARAREFAKAGLIPGVGTIVREAAGSGCGRERR